MLPYCEHVEDLRKYGTEKNSVMIIMAQTVTVRQSDDEI